MTKRWGIELTGAEVDLRFWQTSLKAPFDPHVEEVRDERGNYLVLISIEFEGMDKSSEVIIAGRILFKQLNVIMAEMFDIDAVSGGPVIEFIVGAQPKRHHYLEAKGIEFRIRAYPPEIKVVDRNGNEIASSPAPSKVQRWIDASRHDSHLGSAILYLEGSGNWAELYKAYEALNAKDLVYNDSKLHKRFTQTANHYRHHPGPKSELPTHPMDLSEARKFIVALVERRSQARRI